MIVKMPNRPSSRPGFTYVAEARAREQGPVVVVVSESPGSVAALRRAAEEAAMFSVRLHVVDATAAGRFLGTITEPSREVEDRERAVALSILGNPNVTITRVEGSLADYCQGVGARLLVVDQELFESASEPAGLLEPVMGGTNQVCDLLMVRERSGAVL